MYEIIGISKLVFQRKEVLFLGFIERSFKKIDAIFGISGVQLALLN